MRGINSGCRYKFAPNGGAVPGDRIVGIVSPGQGHHHLSDPVADTERISRKKPERWLDVRWDVDKDRRPQRFSGADHGRSNQSTSREAFAQVATVIAEAATGNIDNIQHEQALTGFHRTYDIDLERLHDLKHLNAIIAQLRANAVVARVERVNGQVNSRSPSCPFLRSALE